jgi:sugar diacid utilization regulator
MNFQLACSENNKSSIDFSQIKLSLYEALYHGNGIKGILTIAEEYYDSHISVCDTSYNIIATSKVHNKTTYGMNFCKEQIYLDPSAIQIMKRYKIIEKIYTTSSAFCYTLPDHPENIWIFCAIRIQNIVTGHLSICYSGKEPKKEDIDLATTLAQIISVEMQKHSYFIDKSGLQYEYFLTDLLEMHFDNLETVYSRLQALDIKFRKYLCIVALSCDDPFYNTIFNKKQMEQLRSIYSNSMSLVYKDNIVLFISQDSPFKFSEEKQLDLLSFLSINNVKAAISQNFTNPMDAKLYYMQASKTLKIGKTHYPKESLFYAADMMLFNILNNCDTSELSSLLLYQLNILQQYDIDYNTELTHTLKTFLKENRNATQTAKSLHIHRSTFFYRIKKIEELLSMSINDSKTLFLSELSFAIQEYLISVQHTPKNNLSADN